MIALAYFLWFFAGFRVVYFFVANVSMNASADVQPEPKGPTPLFGAVLLNLWNVGTVVALILAGVVVFGS